uniref:Palmitoyltransferase n=1 Tax=Arcella intermedia TaxID=1963864 RepID=A0A6B2LAT2_9EUKA
MIVLVVVLLISFGFCSFWYLVVVPWSWWNSAFGMCVLVVFHTCFSLLCYSYYKTIVTPPGVAETNWVPAESTEEELEEAKNQQVKSWQVDDFYKPKWCTHCKAYKPPRSHHCRDFSRCVLRMDHYCPWVNNCVGYKNHKFFLLFLFYASASLIIVLISVIWRFISIIIHLEGKQLDLSIPDILFFVLQAVLTFPLTTCITGLLSYQLSLLVTNCTSVEALHHERYQRDAYSKKMKFRWFYDFGWNYNVQQVMGSTWLEWFLPVTPEHVKSGDGVTYKTRQVQFKQVVVEEEPENSSLWAQKRKVNLNN